MVLAKERIENIKTLKDLYESMNICFDPSKINLTVNLHDQYSLEQSTVFSTIEIKLDKALLIFDKNEKLLYCHLAVKERQEGEFKYYNPCIKCGVVIIDENEKE